MAESQSRTPSVPLEPALDPSGQTRQVTKQSPIPYGVPAQERPVDAKGGEPGADPAKKLVKFKLNDEEIEAAVGTNLIEVARQRGVDIPYYCYHPGLTPAGNCRMCLVEASNSRKPITACTTPVTEGLEIHTHTESVKKARAGVLELMLINHPLDCPICDKSGECMLQDHTFKHGKDGSRMVEPKELKHTKDVGNDIHIWGNRCIVCTRCVRFCDEIAGTGELCVVERADHSVIDVFPDYPLQNSLSGNVVDVCPVGALISKDFLYQARVWYQKRTDSICTGCSRGCNIEIQSKDNQVKRLVPRHNPQVNDYWICDHGRYDHDYVLGERRSLRYQLGRSALPRDAGPVLTERLQAFLDKHGPGCLGGIASPFMTLEEIFLFREILPPVPENSAALARPDGKEEIFKKGFRISADKNPNRRGVEKLLGDGAFGRLEALIQRIDDGEIKGLLVMSDRPHCILGEAPGEEKLLEVLPKLEFLAVFQLERGAEVPPEAAILPATAFPEKDGTMINDDGHLQRLRPATELPRDIRPEIEVLGEVLHGLGRRDRQLGAAGIFRELAAELGLPEATYKDVGTQGIRLGGEDGG
jgi:NADH-quinone oxidoreductase subunit G